LSSDRRFSEIWRMPQSLLKQCHQSRSVTLLYRTKQINCAQKFDHVSSLLRDLHWLRIRERIKFRLAVLVYRCLHNQAPPYLAADLRRVADIESRQRLRSGSTVELDVPSTNCSTIGDRAFSVAAARVWNDLPPFVTSSPSLAVFRQRLKTELFPKSYSTWFFHSWYPHNYCYCWTSCKQSWHKLSVQRDSAVFEESFANGRLVFPLLKMLISNDDDDDDDDNHRSDSRMNLTWPRDPDLLHAAFCNRLRLKTWAQRSRELLSEFQ